MKKKFHPVHLAIAMPMIIAFIIAGCKHEITNGTVTEAYIEPARDYIFMMPIPHKVGKVTFFTYIPIPMHDDADYVLTVDGFTKDGEEKLEKFYVTEDIYRKHKIGSGFCYQAGCSDQPNEDQKAE